MNAYERDIICILSIVCVRDVVCDIYIYSESILFPYISKRDIHNHEVIENARMKNRNTFI